MERTEHSPSPAPALFQKIRSKRRPWKKESTEPKPTSRTSIWTCVSFARISKAANKAIADLRSAAVVVDGKVDTLSIRVDGNAAVMDIRFRALNARLDALAKAIEGEPLAR